MAISYRELYLMVRASNQASAALRRVASDVRGLNAVSGLKQQRAQLGINRQNILTQRQAMANEIQSIATGRRRAAMDRQNLAHTVAMNRAQLAADAVGNRVLQTQEGILRAEAQAQSLRSRMGRARQRFGAESAEMRTLGNLYDANRLKLQRLQKELSMMPRRALAAADTLKKQALSVRELAGREADLAHRQDVLNQRMVTSTQRLAQNAQKLRDVNKAISAARWDRLGMAGRTIQHMGRVVAYAGIVMGASLGYAANAAADFETAAVRVATQTGPIGSGMATVVANSKVLQRAFLNIQASGTASMDAITESAYNLFSTIDQLGDSRAGLAQGAKMLKLFSDAAIAGGVGMEDVTEGIVGTLAAFKNIPPTARNVEKILNRLFATVRFGRTNFAQLSESLTTLTPAARAAGQTLDTMLGTRMRAEP